MERHELTATTTERPGPKYPAVLVFAGLSLLGGFFPAFSLPANLYVLLLGATLLLAGIHIRPRHARADLPPGVVWWLVPIGLFLLVEGMTFILGTSPERLHDYPTLSLLADPLLDHYLFRCLAYFGWLTVFWKLIRR